jgi:hypothetical protein
MGKEEVKKHVQDILKETFKILKEKYKAQKNTESNIDEGSRIIFPTNYTDKNSLRISEQELRFVFVEQLNKILAKNNWYYSVETPTKWYYKFGDKVEDIRSNESPKKSYRSGNFDLAIHDEGNKIIALIEFKARNVSAHDFKKDFEKLCNKGEGDNDTLRCFFLLLESFSESESDGSTLVSIRDKKINPRELSNEEKKKTGDTPEYKNYNKVYFCAYSLKKEETVTDLILSGISGDTKGYYPQDLGLKIKKS